MISVNYKGKTFSVWTEEDDNEGLLNDYLRRIDNRFHFEALLIEPNLTPKSMAEFIVFKSKPEIIIDTREKPHEGFNMDKVKIQIDKLLSGKSAIHHRWIPKLYNNENIDDGLFEVRNLLRSYHRLTFVGDNIKRMNKICKILKKETKIDLI